MELGDRRSWNEHFTINWNTRSTAGDARQTGHWHGMHRVNALKSSLLRIQFLLTCSIKFNTHRRRRRDATVELSCVGGVYLQLVGDEFDESEQICQERVELHRDGGVNAPVGSRRE